jgi:hypothetical protein
MQVTLMNRKKSKFSDPGKTQDPVETIDGPPEYQSTCQWSRIN